MTNQSSSFRQRAPRLLYIVSHPIQYQVPIFPILKQRLGGAFLVAFLDSRQFGDHVDKGYGVSIRWGIPLDQGYDYVALDGGALHWLGLSSITIILKGLLLLARSSYDVVWFHGYVNPVMIALIIASKLSGHKVVLRGESNEFTSGSTSLRLRAVVRSLLFSMADHFFTIGSLNQRFYESQGVSSDDMSLVPYCIDNQRFSAMEDQIVERERLRDRWKIPNSDCKFLFVGRFVEDKGIDVLLDAFEQLLLAERASGLRLVLLLAGEGSARSLIDRVIRRIGPDNIVTLGFVDQDSLPHLYYLADVLVLPSRFEPWGLVVNEAMACKKPVIVSDAVGAAADLLESGDPCIVPAGDPLALMNCMRVLARDPKLRLEIGERNCGRIMKWGYSECVDGVMKGLSRLRLPGR